jgi:hypothetical protein
MGHSVIFQLIERTLSPMGEITKPPGQETSMKRFAVAAIAVSLLGASVAMADGHHDRDGRDNWSGEHRDFDGRC